MNRASWFGILSKAYDRVASGATTEFERALIAIAVDRIEGELAKERETQRWKDTAALRVFLLPTLPIDSIARVYSIRHAELEPIDPSAPHTRNRQNNNDLAILALVLSIVRSAKRPVGSKAPVVRSNTRYIRSLAAIPSLLRRWEGFLLPKTRP